MSEQAHLPPADRGHHVMRTINAAQGRALTIYELASACGGDFRAHSMAPLVWLLVQRRWLAVIPGPWHSQRYIPARLAATWPAK